MKNSSRLADDNTVAFGSLIQFQNQVVPEGESPTKTAQLKEEFLATVGSEMLLAHAALGDGYNSPFPAAEGLVFTSATRQEAHARLRAAEKEFNAWFELQRKDDRDELDRLEEACKPERKASGRSTEYVLDPFAGDPAQIKDKLKALREKLALQSNVTWREHDAHKAALLELLSKSACNAMTYVDERGARLASSLCSPRALAADMSLLTLCKGSADSVLIRSSSTGGASIHSLKGDDSPAFNYFCSAQPEVVEKIGERISNDLSGSPARGSAIVIPVEVNFESSIDWPMFSSDTLLLAMKSVYSRGRLRPEEKLQVTCESPDLQAAWISFFDLPVSAYIEHTPTQADLDTYRKMPANMRTIASFATRAAMTLAILSSLENSPVKPVTLTWETLEMAKQFARLIFLVSSGEKKLARRREGNAKAQASFKTHEKLMVAEEALLKAIRSSPAGKIARTAARNVEGVTLGLLDELVKMDKVVELRGVENIKIGKTSRAYMLKESVQMEAAEAASELEAVLSDPPEVDVDEANAVFRELQRRALLNDSRYFVPAVPVSSMTTKQIAAIPRILRDRADEVVLRGTRDNPEPESVIEDEEDGYPVVADSPNLWFRIKPDGEEFRKCWHESALLGLGPAWGKKSEPTEQ